MYAMYAMYDMICLNVLVHVYVSDALPIVHA